jgi:hypothetical protein
MTREEWEVKQNALKKQYKYITTGTPGNVEKVEMIQKGEIVPATEGGSLNLGSIPILKEDLRSSTRKSKTNPLESIYENKIDKNSIDNDKAKEKDVFGTLPNKLKALLKNKDSNLSDNDIDFFQSMKDNYYKSDEFKEKQNIAKERGFHVPTELDTDLFQSYLEKLAHQDINKYSNEYKNISPEGVIGAIVNRNQTRNINK